MHIFINRDMSPNVSGGIDNLKIGNFEHKKWYHVLPVNSIHHPVIVNPF